MKEGEFLTISEINKKKMVPWIKSRENLKKWILNDFKGENILQSTVISGKKDKIYIPRKRLQIWITEFYSRASLGCKHEKTKD